MDNTCCSDQRVSGSVDDLLCIEYEPIEMANRVLTTSTNDEDHQSHDSTSQLLILTQSATVSEVQALHDKTSLERLQSERPSVPKCDPDVNDSTPREDSPEKFCIVEHSMSDEVTKPITQLISFALGTAQDWRRGSGRRESSRPSRRYRDGRQVRRRIPNGIAEPLIVGL